MHKPRTQGYEALPAHDELDEEQEHENGVDDLAGADVDNSPAADGARVDQSTVSLPADYPNNQSNAQDGSTTRHLARPPRAVRRPPRRTRSGTLLHTIDVSHLDHKLRQWVSTLNAKFAKPRRKHGLDTSKPYDILASAYGPVVPKKKGNRRDGSQNEVQQHHVAISVKDAGEDDSLGRPKTLDHRPPVSADEADAVVEQVKAAISLGVHPRLNKAGTSGSYFAKTPEGRTRAIFKPKNEEPYGSLNPKWSKWFHRNLLSPFFGFGRACLVPNFSYLSEAGASLLSDRLQLYIVPHTSLVPLSSPAFFYDWLDRRAYKQKKRPLPEKIGSFQLFLDGYKDASDFLRLHPWPGRSAQDTLEMTDVTRSRRRKERRNWTRKCRLLCGTAGFDDDESDDEEEYVHQNGQNTETRASPSGGTPVPFQWTPELMTDFRRELEKLVILDVLMRNTDRGLDNFMIKVCEGKCSSRRPSSSKQKPDKEDLLPKVSFTRTQPAPRPNLTVEGLVNDDASQRDWLSRPHIHVAAIDNSLSFPIHHPNSWRSYCYGWLFLPSSLIGQPFSQETRDHFLPLLTSPTWWSRTVFELRKLFSRDEDFSERMFKRQIQVLKGQAWNIVMSLRDPDAGPLELCRRKACIVHDDEVEVADDEVTKQLLLTTARGEVEGMSNEVPANLADATPARTTRPMYDRHVSVDTPNRSAGALTRSMETGVRPSTVRHASADTTAPRSVVRSPPSAQRVHISPRPISVAKHVDLNRPTFGNASGVSMMEHMERLQLLEEDAARSLGEILPNDSEEDVFGENVDSDERMSQSFHGEYEGLQRYGGGSRSRRQGVSLDLGRRLPNARQRSSSIDAAGRRASLDDAVNRRRTADGAIPTKVVIVERVEEVDARPFFAKW